MISLKNPSKNLNMGLFPKLIRVPEITIIIPVILLFLAASLASPDFLDIQNLVSIVRSVSYVGMVAIFMTMLLMNKGLDLSCDSAAAMSSVIFAAAIKRMELPPLVSLAIALGAALILGGINSFLILKTKIPAFVVTLGTMYVAKGVAFIISGGYMVSGLPQYLQQFINFKVFGITVDVIIFIAVAVIADAIIRRTILGRKIRLIGVNLDSARLSGIKTTAVSAKLYSATAISACVAGIMFTCRSQIGMIDVGTGWSLTAITGCLLGGTSIYGGKGSILGTVIGVLFMGIVTNILVLLRINSNWQNTFVGLFMILGILLDVYRNRKFSNR